MKLFNFFGNKTPETNMAKSKFYTGVTRGNSLPAKDQDYSQPIINMYAGRDYVPFGEDNLYPYVLLDFYHSSAFHRAITEFKTRTILGDGLVVTSTEKNVKSQLEVEKIKSILTNAFLKRFIQEYLIHDRVYIKVTRKGDTHSINPLIVPAETVRASNIYRDEEPGFFIADWRRSGRDKFYFKTYDKYNTFDKTQMIEYQELTPGFDTYAVPGYSAAGDWIWLDVQFAYFQKQNMENSINPSAIIKIYEKFANKEQEQEYIEGLQNSFAGAREAGKTMTFVSNGKDLAPDIEMAEPNKLDKSFASAQENIIKNVSRAHLINPALMGIESAGKLGNSNELNEAFTLFNEVWLSSNQDVIDANLQDLVKKLGYPDIKVSLGRKTQFLNSIAADAPQTKPEV